MKKAVALVLALALMFSAGCAGKENKTDEENRILEKFIVAGAEYPTMAQYPDENRYFKADGSFDDEGFDLAYAAWRADKKQRQDQPEGYQNGLEDFFAASIKQLLSGTDGGNRVYSPLNVYMALAMLAETTATGSREQILELLGQNNIEALREQARAVWNANYSADGALNCLLANSLWLDEKLEYEQTGLDSLAENYRASIYSGKMGDDEFNAALQAWLDQQTGGLLAEQSRNVELPAETALALISTVYFSGRWNQEFNPGATESGEFTCADGMKVNCDFMNKSGSQTYFWGDDFASVSLAFNGGGSMSFILPDDGISVDELLTQEEMMNFILARNDWEQSKYLIVNMSVPKFDISSELELSEALKELGITEIFDAESSDFSPILKDSEGVFLSEVTHAARVVIDEEGGTAAAFTVMKNATSAMPPDEEVDFVLDRPFVFVLYSLDGLPLFVGVVNNLS